MFKTSHFLLPIDLLKWQCLRLKMQLNALKQGWTGCLVSRTRLILINCFLNFRLGPLGYCATPQCNKVEWTGPPFVWSTNLKNSFSRISGCLILKRFGNILKMFTLAPSSKVGSVSMWWWLRTSWDFMVVCLLKKVAGGSFIHSAHVTYLVWVKQMYSQSIHLTHELKLCIKIPRGRVYFLTKIPKLKVLAGTEFLTLKKLVKCMHATELQNIAFLFEPHQP